VSSIALAQGRFRALAFGDVVDYDEHGRAPVKLQCVSRDLHVEDARVARSMAQVRPAA
jgi:hypothetical protein